MLNFVSRKNNRFIENTIAERFCMVALYRLDEHVISIADKITAKCFFFCFCTCRKKTNAVTKTYLASMTQSAVAIWRSSSGNIHDAMMDVWVSKSTRNSGLIHSTLNASTFQMHERNNVAPTIQMTTTNIINNLNNNSRCRGCLRRCSHRYLLTESRFENHTHKHASVRQPSTE